MTLLVCATLLVISTLSVINGESCGTPDGSQGNCVQVLSCPVLADIVHNKDRTPEQITLLKKSGCGSEKGVPKVCCPKVCVTPEGEQGSCVSRSSCTHLSKNEKVKSCMGSDSICCPPKIADITHLRNCEKILTAFPFPKKSYCCGTDSVTDLKISYGGGQPSTAVDQYPLLSLIEYQKANKTTTKQFCSGSLISGKYILTAAQCITERILNQYTPIGVRLGEYDTTKDMDCSETPHDGLICASANDTVTIPVESFIPHPDFDPTTKQNDIALIRLKELAPYTDFIKPLCLPTKDHTLEKLPVFDLFIAGWGIKNFTNSLKQDVLLKFVEQKDCQKIYSQFAHITSGQVCAGGEIGKNACRGSFGGTLMYNKRGSFEAFGVMSFGSRPLCSFEEVPTVFTKVFEYIDWIYSVIEP